MDTGAFMALFLIFGVGGTILWIFALVDAAKVPYDSMYRAGSKLVWILVIVLTGFIGAIIYYAVGRPAGGTAAVLGQGRGGVRIDFRGVRYTLGRSVDAYVILGGSAGGAVIRRYPLTEEGWQQAWQAYYHELEGAPPPQPGG